MSEHGISVPLRLARVLLIMGAIVGAVVVAVRSGAISLPGLPSSHAAQSGARASLGAERTADDRRWASAVCTDILDWKNEIHGDETSLNLGFGPLARVRDAIAASTRAVSELDKLGLPPAQSARGQADTEQLRSDIQSQVRALEGAAGSVAGGNLGALGTLVSSLENDQAMGAQLAGELRHVLSADLGLSLIETRACRQLVGFPI